MARGEGGFLSTSMVQILRGPPRILITALLNKHPRRVASSWQRSVPSNSSLRSPGVGGVGGWEEKGLLLLRPLLLGRHLEALPQALHLQLLAGAAAVDVLHIVGGGLKVRRGVVALGDEEVVLGAILQRLVDGDWGALDASQSRCLRYPPGSVALTMNCSSTLPRRSRPGWSSRWWLAVVSAMVETMAI